MFIILAGSFDLLSVHPGLVFWTVITFLTVLLLLWLFAWKPLIRALDSRNDKIENDLRESQHLREEAEKLLKEYEEKIENSRKEARLFMEQSKKDAISLKEKILQKAEAEAKELRAKTKKEIEQAKEAVISEVRNSIVDASILLLSKILKEDVEDETHKQIILDKLKDMPPILKN